MSEIAEKLNAFRLTNGMTLTQPASKAGCTDAYLSQLERGRANSSIMILKKVASALQMKVVDFFPEPETKENDVVCKERKRVNICFKQGDAKIQVLVRGIQNKRMWPFYVIIQRLKPGVDQTDLTLVSEKNLELFSKERQRSM